MSEIIAASPDDSNSNGLILDVDDAKVPDHNPVPLGRMPTTCISQQMLKELKDGDCAICLKEYEAGDVQRVLPCQHAFHKACVDIWFNTSQKVTCPVCKRTVLEVPNSVDTAGPDLSMQLLRLVTQGAATARTLSGRR